MILLENMFTRHNGKIYQACCSDFAYERDEIAVARNDYEHVDALFAKRFHRVDDEPDVRRVFACDIACACYWLYVPGLDDRVPRA